MYVIVVPGQTIIGPFSELKEAQEYKVKWFSDWGDSVRVWAVEKPCIDPPWFKNSSQVQENLKKWELEN
jgi:hypothetical protein